MPAYILSLDSPLATLSSAGGKGMSLSRLSRGGLPVPPGFIITTQAYQTFVGTNGIQAKILRALKNLDVENPGALEICAHSIGEFFSAGHIPNDLILEISDALEGLSHGRPLPVAVRSSATAEDLPGASFAGQQESYLNICGSAPVIEAVRRCWASLWSARAIAYRAQRGIDPMSVSIAVIVQELIPAGAAGVVFSANPLNGKRSELMITATWGLGEALVAGLVTPDTLVISRDNFRVLRRQVARKRVQTSRAEGGTSQTGVFFLRQYLPVLGRRQINALCALALKIEQLSEVPVDIEWALAGDRLYILQARPITALPSPPPEWRPPVPGGIFARGSLAEFVPEPVSPLFASLAVPVAREETQKMMLEMGLSEPENYLFEVLNNYIYVGFKFTPKLTWDMLRLTFGLTRTLFANAESRALAMRALLLEEVKTWQKYSLDALDPPDLLNGAVDIFRACARYYAQAQSGTIPTSMSSESLLRAFYNCLVKRRGDVDASAFVFGMDNKPMLADKSLYDLAMFAREQAELFGYLESTPAEEICAAFLGGQTPVPEAAEFFARFRKHLQEHAQCMYDLDFARPTPAEAPVPQMETLKLYMHGTNSPYERQQAAEAIRRQAEEAITQRLDPLRRKWFLKLLRWAQDTAPLRENSIADMGLGHPQIRRMLLELGRRFALGGAIQQPEDIYYLEKLEVEFLAIYLKNGEKLEDYSAVVQKRREQWQAMRQINPPLTLPHVRWLSLFYPSEKQTGDVLRGFGASAGSVTARACVLLGPEDFGTMQTGDILVAGITTPAWTPLFARAAGIVTDIGGPLSHSSIVAREYNIPAVLATGNATRRIHTGQMISVDGTRGEVKLHKS